MASDKSTIQLTPASAAFVANRVDTLGPWVLGAFTDCILLGVVFCQVITFYTTRSPRKTTAFQRYCFWLVAVVLCLSVLKTCQEIAVVWVQNVHDFADPDVARLRVATAWWQVSTPLMTGVIGCVVQSFFCFRFWLLSRDFRSRYLVIPIVCSMTVGITGICFTVYNILCGNVKAKVMWLLIHLTGVFIADFLITTGTIVILRKSASGLPSTNLLINRLLRLVFESAIPPTVIASIDLIMTQTLGPKLIWHLLLNFSLGKIYVISLLYTLNSINEYRRSTKDYSNEIYTSGGRITRGVPSNVEFADLSATKDQIYIQTQVSTYISPSGKGD
ncbi:hypothetical protein DFH06DRAFT_699743 [Mycena polygramma]|nr:hypothetical protein DFH06DRAFT_699743 [Mycena polygramma]